MPTHDTLDASVFFHDMSYYFIISNKKSMKRISNGSLNLEYFTKIESLLLDWV